MPGVPIRIERAWSERRWAAVLVSSGSGSRSASVMSGRTIAPQRLGHQLRLGLGGGVGAGEAVDHQGLAVLELREDGHAQRGADRLLGHGVRVVAVAAGEGDAAPLPLVRALRAGAGVAGPLLPEQLLARARHVGPAPGVHGADPAVGQVHDHHVVEELLVDLAAEVGRVDRLLADPGTGAVVDGYCEHGSFSSSQLSALGCQPEVSVEGNNQPFNDWPRGRPLTADS